MAVQFNADSWFDVPVEERVIDVLADVMMSLRDLPPFARDGSPIAVGSYWFPVYQACLESFFTKARLAAEFFVKMPSRDFTARTFVPDWEPPPGVANRLERVWLMTSRHIVHLSKDRVPTNPDDWRAEDTTYGGMMRITRDAYRALTAFVDAYEAADGEYAPLLRDLHGGVKPHSLRELVSFRKEARQRWVSAPPQTFPYPI